MAYNLFDNIFDQFTKQAQPQMPSFATPQAPRTSSYVAPNVPYGQSQTTAGGATTQQKGINTSLPMGIPEPYLPKDTGIDTTPREQRPVYNFLQNVSDVVTSLPGRFQETVQQDQTKFEQDIKKKQLDFANAMLAKGYAKPDIFRKLNELKAKGEFDFKPGISESIVGGMGTRLQSNIDTTERLSKIQDPLERTLAGVIPYAGQTVASVTQPIASALEPYVSPVVKAIVEKTGQTQNIQDLSNQWSQFEKTNPILAENIAGALNVAQLAPVPFAKPVGNAIEQGVKTGAKTLVKGAEAVAPRVVEGIKTGISTTADIAVQAPKKLVRSGVSALEKIKPGIKDDLANIDPPSRYAVERATPERVSSIIEEAKQAKMNPEADYQQTPYHKGAEMANKTVDTIEGNLRKRQAERMSILENVPLERVNLESARNSLRSELDKLNIEDITIDDAGKPVVVSKKGRSALLDSKNTQDMQAIEKLREILIEDVSPLQTMDNIKILQEWLYENKGTIALKGISKKMEGIVSKVQGSLNKTFKDQLPPEYKKIMDSMSEDIVMNDKIKRLFGIGDDGNPVGNRGELVMKRLTNGTTTGGEARTLAKEILDKYGIDLIQEARLRQLSMELVGDTRGANLFGVLLSGKKGMMDWAMGKVGDVLIDKENLIKSYAGKGTIIKPKKQSPLYTKPKQNGTPLRNNQNSSPLPDTKGSTKVTPKKQERDLLQEKYNAEQKNEKPIIIEKKPIVKPKKIKLGQ